jgi:hypothetical protein
MLEILGSLNAGREAAGEKCQEAPVPKKQGDSIKQTENLTKTQNIYFSTNLRL